jgi:hypothetical protein
MRFPPSMRLVTTLLVLASLSTGMAWCPAPDDSGLWRFVDEVVQNQRVASSRTYDVSGWRTVASAANLGATAQSATLTAGYDTNTSVSASILRWGLGSSNRVTWTHTFGVTVPANSRVRLLHQRREEIRDMVWDVMCAWRHASTGQARLTTYGLNYRGTIWRLFDAYQLLTEPL